MLKSDATFGTTGRISLKNIVLILKYQMATLASKTYYNRKIYNEEVTDKLQFLEDKKLNVNLIKESPENNLT